MVISLAALGDTAAMVCTSNTTDLGACDMYSKGMQLWLRHWGRQKPKLM